MLIIHISPFVLNLLLLKLKIENWKYCNKIIFKCVNSTEWPFLIFFSVWIVIFVSCTVNSYEVTVHAWIKKRGGECETWTQLSMESKRPHNIQRYTVAYSDRLDSGFFAESCGAFFLFFFFAFMRFGEGGDKFYCSWDKCHCSHTIVILFMHC